MKRIFAVFLFCVSFNLFAKEEVGRFIWEFRDYDRDWRYEIPANVRKYHWREIEMHFTSTIPTALLIDPDDGERYVVKYGKTYIMDDNGVINAADYKYPRLTFIDDSRFIVMMNYAAEYKGGAWRTVNGHMDFGGDPTLPIYIRDRFLGLYGPPIRSNPSHARYNILCYKIVESFVVVMNYEHPGNNFTWEGGYDFEEEEMYFTQFWRIDEHGVKYHSFRAIYRVYRN